MGADQQVDHHQAGGSFERRSAASRFTFNVAHPRVVVMVELTFELDEEVFAADSQSEPPYESRVVLVETYFELPIYFIVEGVDLTIMTQRDRSEPVGLPGGGTLLPGTLRASVPILNVATSGLGVIRTLVKRPVQTYEMPGGLSIDFAYSGPVRVDIYSHISMSSAVAPYDQLLAAFERFARQTRDLMLTRVPWLARFPEWKRWLATLEW
jgi:hypothetical protein